MSERFAGRYLLLRRLGHGGMGEVFLARDLTTGTECALKRLRIRGQVPETMRREFEALTRVRHPAVVGVLELGIAPDGSPYVTMEYVPAVGSDRALARGDWPASIFVATQVALGLEALHTAGVLHGDLKPSNILVVPASSPGVPPAGVRLVDFGLAALGGHDEQGHRGTPGFAAPETVRGEPLTPASDLYGLGATLFALIAGRPAFEDSEPGSMLRRQQAGPPPALTLEEAGAPAPLVQLVLRMMAPQPSERPRDAREVRRELERMHPWARRPLAERLQAVVVVGRERELARLAQWCGGAGQMRAVVISGDAGAGKSTLLAELATRMTLDGRSVAHVSCASLQGPGEIARALLRRMAAEAHAEPDPGSLSPTARAIFTDGDALLNEQDLGELAEAAARWSAAMKRPPLALLDDAERLDPLSFAWIRRLVVHASVPPIQWIWARRTLREGLPEEERVLIEGSLAEHLELGALDADSVARLAGARLNEPVPAALARLLWDRAGGHPGLTIEVLRTAAASGAIEEGEAGLVVHEDRLDAVGVPTDFEASLLRRFDELPALARDAATALAVWGRPLSAEDVLALAPGSDEAALAVLLASGLAARDDGGTLALRPPALGEDLLRRLEPERRRGLHRDALKRPGLAHTERFRHLQVAGDAPAALEAAEAAFDLQPDDRLAAAAAALAETTSPALAAAWHDRAAHVLSARGRYAAAIPHLERSLALEAGNPARPERWVRLSSACLESGMLSGAADAIARALREDPPAGPRAKLLCNEAGRFRTLGDIAAQRATLEEALRIAETSGDAEALGAVIGAMAYLLLDEQRTDEAEAMALRSAEAYGRAGHTLGQVRSIGTRAACARARGQLTEAERLYREALETARVRGNRLAMEEVLRNLGVVLVEAGRWTAAREVYDEVARIAFEDARSSGAAGAVVDLAQVDGLTGRVRSARRHARAAMRLTRAYVPRLQPYAMRSAAQAHRIAGRLRKAEAAAGRALTLAMKTTPEDLGWCRVEFGRTCAALSRWKEAAAVWDAGLKEPVASGVVTTVLQVLSGRAALQVGDLEKATARLAAAESWLAGRAAPYAAALALHLRSALALRQGRSAEAIEEGRRALDRLAALPAPPDLGTAALDLARLAPATAELRAAVGGWLELAARTFERLGDRRSQRRSLAMMVEWLKSSDPRAPSALEERSLIERVSWLLNSLSELPELMQRAMRMAVEQLDAERGMLLLIEGETGQLAPKAEYGAVDADTRREAMRYSRRVVERVTESGDSLLITDAPADPRAASESVVDLHLRSILCVPMFLGGQVVGAVYLDDSRRAHTFSEANRGMLEGFSHLMAVAIEKSRGHEEVERAKELLEGENLSLRREVGLRFSSHNVIGSSSHMKRVLAMVEHAARTNTTVLITGENGTGKELVARTLHHSGRRRMKAFVAVNCGAIPETLIESELFGILPNVATGVRARAGRFVQASGGTLFLDEIGEMPLKQQVALLSAIANREITPVGGGKPIPIDVRIIAATNQNLRRQVEQGAFREDLYYRLNVIEVEVPPLRERKADVPALAKHFLEQFAQQQEREAPTLSPEFLAAVMQSDWPGNVRELQNYVERMLAMTPGKVLYPDPLPRDLQDRSPATRLSRKRRLIDTVVELERRMVGEALMRARGNQSHAARELGLTEQSLRYRIRKYGLAPVRENQRTRRK